jgi:DNA mismatch endonuclease (patch repair protein)
MSAIKSKGTKPEKLLSSAMWCLGLRYRKQYKIIGKPDFVLLRAKIAIFCDGDFWHGNNWRLRGYSSQDQELSKYSAYWVDKLKKNKARDNYVTSELKSMGWIVLRFWESDIKLSPEACANKVYEEYNKWKINC